MFSKIILYFNESVGLEFFPDDVEQFELIDVLPTFYEKGISYFADRFWIFIKPNVLSDEMKDTIKNLSVVKVSVYYDGDEPVTTAFVPLKFSKSDDINDYYYVRDVANGLFITCTKDFSEDEVPDEEYWSDIWS